MSYILWFDILYGCKQKRKIKKCLDSFHKFIYMNLDILYKRLRENRLHSRKCYLLSLISYLALFPVTI